MLVILNEVKDLARSPVRLFDDLLREIVRLQDGH
jgi:hypothetical protein